MLFEVTSDSSEGHDTGAKLAFYRTIPSLREVVIVSHRERRIVVHFREGDDEHAWQSRVAVAGGQVSLPSPSCPLVVDDIYRRSEIP